MGRRLAVNVLLRDPATGENALFTPDDDVPEWAEAEITNPDAWASSRAAPAAKTASSAPAREATGPAATGSGGGFDVAGANVKQVLEHVGEDKTKVKAALAAEKARGDDARKSLVDKLEKLAG